MKQIEHVNIITPIRILWDGCICVDGGKITGIYPSGQYPKAPEGAVIHGRGLYAAPGFIDIHVHGGGGYDTTDGVAQEIVAMAEAHAKYGTTSILPTTLAAPIPVLCQAIDAVKEAQKQCEKSNILGIHLEGPYFAQSQRGAQSPEHIKSPDKAEYLPLLDRWDGIRMMGAAPELEGALELGRELQKRGITASIAHTDATYEDVERAIESGYTDVTHIYSGCSSVVRKNAYRIAGVVEAGLEKDELTVQVIADGKHLPPPLLKLIYRCKGADRISLITDGLSFSASQLEEGVEYVQKNGVRVVLEDGVMKLLDRQSFAGSVATSSRLVRNMMQLAGASLTDAVKMATWTPARVIGVSDHKGMLARDYDADIILMDEQVNVKWVMVRGTVAYDFM